MTKTAGYSPAVFVKYLLIIVNKYPTPRYWHFFEKI